MTSTRADVGPGEARSTEALRRLELTVVHRLDGLLHGDYRGLLPGHGSETGETRPYVPGDDPRRIDWNVSARSTETHVRDSIADRELETWVLVDRSASLEFGTADMTKADLAVQAVGAIGFLTARSGNRLGAVTFGRGGVHVIPARSGRTHLLSVLRQLQRSDGATDRARTATDLGSAIGHLLRPPRRRGLAVVVSDFLSAGDWTGPMRVLAARHDVLAIEIVDPRELELPSVGVLTVVDPETGRTRDVATSRRLRRRYAEAAAAQRASIADGLRQAGAGHLRLRTDRDWVLDVVRYVADRRRLRAVTR